MAEPKSSLEAWEYFSRGRLPGIVGRYLKCTVDHKGGRLAAKMAPPHPHEILDARIIEMAGPDWDGPAVRLDTGEIRFRVDTEKEIAESMAEFKAPIRGGWTPQRAPLPEVESSLRPSPTEEEDARAARESLREAQAEEEQERRRESAERRHDLERQRAAEGR